MEQKVEEEAEKLEEEEKTDDKISVTSGISEAERRQGPTNVTSMYSARQD